MSKWKIRQSKKLFLKATNENKNTVSNLKDTNLNARNILIKFSKIQNGTLKILAYKYWKPLCKQSKTVLGGNW